MEVFQLASSRGSMNMPDLQDVAAVLEGFEEVNTCRIQVTLELKGQGLLRHLLVGAVAYDRRETAGEVTTLASVSVTSLASNLKNVTAVVIHALYMLDGKIAYQEMQSAENKKA